MGKGLLVDAGLTAGTRGILKAQRVLKRGECLFAGNEYYALCNIQERLKSAGYMLELKYCIYIYIYSQRKIGTQ